MVSAGRSSRRCRASMARTTKVVQRAASSWAVIFQHEIPEFSPKSLTCTELQKEVKQFLSNCPSSEETERMAFQSIKKLLPPSCKCQEKDLLLALQLLLTKKARELPKGYLSFVRKTISSLFRKGWDSGSYDKFCFTASPSLSGTIGSSRREGGCLGEFTDHIFFLDSVTGRQPYTVPKIEAELMVVQSAGKPRPLTKFSSMEFLLKPLHKSIYDRLSKTRWLCRGDPTDDKLKKAGFRRGGILVSGDYKSATDNLPLEVAEVILSVILENSVSVPDSVKDHAMRVLRPLLWNLDHDLEFEVSQGQMMGSFLSFPLLCLQNYLCFEWARKESGLERMPLLINGDDILFETWDDGFPQRWMEVVGRAGLEVERSKTSVDVSLGSLNSTLFKWNDDGFLSNVPTLRFGMLRAPDYPGSLGTSFHSFVRGQPQEILWRASRAFFSWHLSTIKSVRLTLDELGFRGGLAFRMGRIFGLSPRDLDVWELPIAPIPHCVVLSSEEVTMIARDRMSDELLELNSREMTSWKYSVDFVDLREKAALRYCILLSMVRPWREEIPTVLQWSSLSDVINLRKVRKRYFRQRDGVEKLVPVFDRILQSQDIQDYEQLPPYGVESWGDEAACQRLNGAWHAPRGEKKTVASDTK